MPGKLTCDDCAHHWVSFDSSDEDEYPDARECVELRQREQ